MSQSPENTSRWPHRLAVALACATFPLIWVGGLVTTYDAGMAAPDWPTTFGYNPFLYPLATWLSGPWNLFIEHGHRLLGWLVGFLSLAFLASVWGSDRRVWMRRMAILAVALVATQGLLGGLRVVLDERFLAMVHGCVGPAFFAYCVALVAVTSPAWSGGAPAEVHRHAASFQVLTTVTTALAYVQLVVGAQLRHMPVTAEPGVFRATLTLHLVLAALVLAHALWLAGVTLWRHGGRPALWRPGAVLGLLALVQIGLGAGAYVANYGFPGWAVERGIGAGYVVYAQGTLQAQTTTAHQACGSLIVAASLWLCLKSWRFLRAERGPALSTAVVGGVAA